MEKPKERTYFNWQECRRFMENKYPAQNWFALQDFFSEQKELSEDELFRIHLIEDEDFESSYYQEKKVKEAFDLFVEEFGIGSRFLFGW
jgi:hypothetical protein